MIETALVIGLRHKDGSAKCITALAFAPAFSLFSHLEFGLTVSSRK